MRYRIYIDRAQHGWEPPSKGYKRSLDAGFHALAPPTFRPLFHLRD